MRLGHELACSDREEHDARDQNSGRSDQESGQPPRGLRVILQLNTYMGMA